MEKKLKEAELVADCLQMFSELYEDSVSLEDTLQRVLKKILSFSDWLFAEAWICQAADPHFTREIAWPQSLEKESDVAKARILPTATGILSKIKRSQKQEWADDPLSDSQDLELSNRISASIRTIFGIPILYKDQMIGALLFYSPKGKNEEGLELHILVRTCMAHMGGLVSGKRIKQSLQESETRMRKVLENMPILFLAVDDTFRPVSWNHECEKVIGYSEDQVLGNENFIFEKFLKQQNAGNTVSLDPKVLEQDFKNWELELSAQDGKTKTVSLSNISSEFPLPGWNKWFVGVDITRTKEIEQDLKSSLKELSDFQTALNAVSIVAITDRAGTIIYVNQNFCDISGYSRDELLGQNHRIINSGYHSKDFFKNLWKTISKGNIWQGEIKNRAKDGRYYWVDTTISPILDESGKPHQYLAIRNDITERKETEEKARHAENNLKTLQDRMSPHFLFNTLSIIHSYLQTNPELADSAILMLADNYRFLTDHANKQLVPFDIEWSFMENYLNLLRLRFSDFLEVEVEKKGNFSRCQLPPLTLQPLVENSYIHGLRNKKGKGKISVHAFIDGDKTRIVIRDDGVGLKTENVYSRTLANISERLKFYLYESEVKIENHQDGGAVVTVSFNKPKNEKLGDLKSYDQSK